MAGALGFGIGLLQCVEGNFEISLCSCYSLEEIPEADGVEGGGRHDLVELFGTTDGRGHGTVVALGQPFRRQLHMPFVVGHERKCRRSMRVNREWLAAWVGGIGRSVSPSPKGPKRPAFERLTHSRHSRVCQRYVMQPDKVRRFVEVNRRLGK